MDFAFCTKTTIAAAASSVPFYYYLSSVSDWSSSIHQKYVEKKNSFKTSTTTTTSTFYFWNNNNSNSSSIDSSSSISSSESHKMFSRAAGVNRLAFARVGAYCIPATGKKSPTGEDGFFIATNGRSLGVADGVGGWAEQGVDPSIFTRNFMRYALDETQKADAISKDNQYCSAIGLMQTAFNRVMKDKLLGSCAALFCTLEDKAPVMNQAAADGDSDSAQAKKQKRRMADVPTGPFGTLNVANVGDCGIAIIRGGMGVVFSSREQQRSFNFPYQLGPEGDTPASALICDYAVAAGDIVILGSDGLFDNVYPDMLPNVIFNEWRKKLPKGAENANLAISDLPPIDCEAVAQIVAKMAYQSGKDRQHLSPFSLRARMGGLEYQGGKPDDITVIVGQILDTGAVVASDNNNNNNTKTYKLEIPQYQLIEQFFQKYPLASIQSKL